MNGRAAQILIHKCADLKPPRAQHDGDIAAADGAIVVKIALALRVTARSPLTEYCCKICAGNKAVAIKVSRAARIGALHDGVDLEFPNQHVFINGAITRGESE